MRHGKLFSVIKYITFVCQLSLMTLKSSDHVNHFPFLVELLLNRGSGKGHVLAGMETFPGHSCTAASLIILWAWIDCKSSLQFFFQIGFWEHYKLNYTTFFDYYFPRCNINLQSLWQITVYNKSFSLCRYKYNSFKISPFMARSSQR